MKVRVVKYFLSGLLRGGNVCSLRDSSRTTCDITRLHQQHHNVCVCQNLSFLGLFAAIHLTKVVDDRWEIKGMYSSVYQSHPSITLCL